MSTAQPESAAEVYVAIASSFDCVISGESLFGSGRTASLYHI